jgi:hypothetical protein
MNLMLLKFLQNNGSMCRLTNLAHKHAMWLCVQGTKTMRQLRPLKMHLYGFFNHMMLYVEQ